MLKPPLQPMLLSTVEEPFDSPDYLFELKWDGFRSLIFINKADFYLQSRNQKNLTPFFPEFSGLKDHFNATQLVIDGEICYINAEGKPSFSVMQKRLMSKNPIILERYPLTFIVWDILEADGQPFYQLPLQERRERLTKVIAKETELLQLSPAIPGEGKKLYQQAEELQFEGIVAKKLDSPYQFRRSNYWIKIKLWQYTDKLIGGYTMNQEGLLVGEQHHGKLQYMGKIKITLPPDEKTALFKFLPDIRIKEPPFQLPPELKNIVWVNPVLTCTIKYTELTEHNSFRHGYAVKLKI